MPRKARIDAPGALHHISSSKNDGDLSKVLPLWVYPYPMPGWEE
jgi:hypothetical protein